MLRKQLLVCADLVEHVLRNFSTLLFFPYITWPFSEVRNKTAWDCKKRATTNNLGSGCDNSVSNGWIYSIARGSSFGFCYMNTVLKFRYRNALNVKILLFDQTNVNTRPCVFSLKRCLYIERPASFNNGGWVVDKLTAIRDRQMYYR